MLCGSIVLSVSCDNKKPTGDGVLEPKQIISTFPTHLDFPYSPGEKLIINIESDWDSIVSVDMDWCRPNVASGSDNAGSEVSTAESFLVGNRE